MQRLSRLGKRTPGVVYGAPLSLVFALGCGGNAAFRTQFPDNSPDALAAVLAEIGPSQASSRPRNALGRPIVVAERSDRKALVAVDLGRGRTLWERDLDVRSVPMVSGPVVVVASGRDVLGLDVRTGETRWRVSREGRSFRGADGEGNLVALTLGEITTGRATATAGRSVVLGLDAVSGSRRFRHEVDQLVAKPAVSHGLVFVPWARQNLTILDDGGREIARLRSTDDVFSFALSRAEGVFYGSRGVYRLTEGSTAGTRSASAFFVPSLGDVPGQPEFAPDGYMEEAGGGSARDKIRFFLAPTSDARRMGFAGGLVYFLYYRYLFAFDAEGSILRWVYRGPEDIVSVAVHESGPLVLDSEGRLTRLSRDDGLPRWAGALGFSVAGATMDALGFAPAETSGASDSGLRRRLLEVVFDPDNRLAPASAFAARLLARIDSAEITGDLIDIASRRSLAAGVRNAAAEALLRRTSGGDHLVEALGRRYSFLDDMPAPPVGLLSRAAVAMQLTSAVPGLVRHLSSHETPISDLPDVAAAIGRLGDRSAAAALRDFVVRYHADDVLGDVGSTLILAAEAALRLGGPDEVTALRRVAEDPFCAGDLATSIREALARLAPEATPSSPDEPEPVQPDPPEATVEAETPRFLADAVVQETLAPLYDDLRACVIRNKTTPSPPARVRLVFVVYADGHVERTTASPSNPATDQCLAEQLALVQFPVFVNPYQQVIYWLPIRAGSLTPAPAARPPAGSNSPPSQSPDATAEPVP